MFADVATQMERIERGIVEVVPRDELIQKLERSRQANRPLRVKVGFDPTAPDIHLGHAVPLGKLRDFQDLGHQVVVIIGDYTARVGDPSGRSQTRPQLTAEEIEANARTYFEQVGKILDLGRIEIVRNGDWFAKMTFADVIQLASKLTVARLIEREDFSQRLKAGTPVSLHEFLYPLMQGYDSVVVRADIELGATEQKFNLLVGRDLQRDAGQEPQAVITLPILVGTDGVKKMSKSLGNYIGVSEAPEMQFGKTMSIPDALLRDYFILATSRPMAEVEAVLAQGKPMAAKMALARAIVARYHGEDAARAAQDHFDRTVRQKELPDDVPEVVASADLFKDGKVWIVRLLVHCGMAASNGEARRLVSQGAVTLDGEAVKSPDAELAVASGMVLKCGKRRYARLKVG